MARKAVVVNCESCGVSFIQKQPNHKYCTAECRPLYVAVGWDKSDRLCVVCKKTFSPVMLNHKFCTSICRINRTKKRRSTYSHPNIKKHDSRPAGCIDSRGTVPKSRYVYMWFKGDDVLPFYIGNGTGNRAYMVHYSSNTTISWSERVRQSAKGFRVEIVRDNLTNEGSMLLESALIAIFNNLGAKLTNQMNGVSRQEIPPLELGESTVNGDDYGA